MRTYHLLFVVLLSACAAEVPRNSTVFTPDSGREWVLQMHDAVRFDTQTSYPSTIPALSKWRYVGAIPEGAVFKIQDNVFTVTGRHVHEAFLVVKDRAVVGVYLPYEKAFSPLPKKVVLPIQ